MNKIDEFFLEGHVRPYARPAEYITRINAPFNYQTPDPRKDYDGFQRANEEWISALNYELVRYLQLMYTAVGRRIYQLDQFMYAWEIRLLKELLPEIYIPIIKWMKEDNFPLNPKIEVLINQLSAYQREHNSLSRPWDNTIYRTFLDNKSKNISIEYFLDQFPIKLDIENSCFKLYLPSGKEFYGDVSCYQIMESMANIIQIQKAGKLEKKLILKDCSNMLKLQNNFPILFMIQSGILENPDWAFLLYTFMMCISQISLMMNPLTLELHGGDKYKKFINKLQPGKIFLELLQRTDVFSSFSGAIHGNLLLDILIQSDLFKSGKQQEVNPDNSRNGLRKDWFKICDMLCELVKIPPYTYMVELTIKEAIEDKRCATEIQYARAKTTDKKEELRRVGLYSEETLPLAESRGRQFDVALKLLEKIRTNSDYIIHPFDMLNNSTDPGQNIPQPPMLTYDDELVIIPGQEKLWDATITLGRLHMMHFVNRIFLANNLCCYQFDDGSDISYPCKDFNNCINRDKNSFLEFCNNEGWKEYTKFAFKALGIKKYILLK